MKESIQYFRFFQSNLNILLLGGLVGTLIGLGVVYVGGYKYVAVNVLELVSSEGQIQSRTLVADAAVVWAREVARERGWIDSSYRYRVYKDGPLVVKTEIEGSDLGVVQISKRFNEELTTKYGFGELRRVELKKEKVYSYLYVTLLGGIGVAIGLGFCLLRSYKRNF
jgi:D-alanine-D-alanine ligase-like ATP-grasp enzyme